MNGVTKLSAFRVAQTDALAKSLQVSTDTCLLAKAAGRIDSTAASATYYVQFLKACTLPANGTVTHLFPPIKIKHSTGTDSTFDLDVTNGYVTSTKGLFIVVSSTEFIKTIVTSDILVAFALHH